MIAMKFTMEIMLSCGWPSSCIISIGISLLSIPRSPSSSSISDSESPRREMADLFVGFWYFGGLRVENKLRFRSKDLLASSSNAA